MDVYCNSEILCLPGGKDGYHYIRIHREFYCKYDSYERM